MTSSLLWLSRLPFRLTLSLAVFLLWLVVASLVAFGAAGGVAEWRSVGLWTRECWGTGRMIWGLDV